MMLYFERINRVMERLDDAQFGELMKAVIRYAQDEPDVKCEDFASQLVFDMLKDQIDADKRRYDEISEKRRYAGQKGGQISRKQLQANDSNCKQLQANAYFAKQTQAKVSKSKQNKPYTYTDTNPDPETDPDTDTDTAPRKSTRAFTRPTLAQVTDYITENGYHIDAQRFVDYYDSNGWKVGKNPMKDWKAAVRTWARNSYGGGEQHGTGSTDTQRPTLSGITEL